MIYFFDNYSNLPMEKAHALLPETRFNRFNRFKTMRDKENCLGAYLLLCLALRDFGITDFELEYSTNGKPFLKGNNKFFNISHCKKGIAVAVSDFPVGIDIQETVSYNTNVMKRVFTKEEKDFVETSDDKDKAFTTIWTLKESAVKCTDKTLTDMQNYSFENAISLFKKYGMTFSTLCIDNIIISVCGAESISDENKIIKKENLI